MSTATRPYTRALVRRLRMRNVPATTIEEAVAVVEAHVRDTGEDPRESFGPPREYARTFPRGTQPRARAGRYVLGWLVASLAGALLVHAASAAARDAELAGGVDPRAGVVTALVVLVAWTAWLLAALLHVGRRPSAPPRR